MKKRVQHWSVWGLVLLLLIGGINQRSRAFQDIIPYYTERLDDCGLEVLELGKGQMVRQTYTLKEDIKTLFSRNEEKTYRKKYGRLSYTPKIEPYYVLTFSYEVGEPKAHYTFTISQEGILKVGEDGYYYVPTDLEKATENMTDVLEQLNSTLHILSK